jgi:hypothetical protein
MVLQAARRRLTGCLLAEEVELATMHRSLETLRAAMNWGMAQTPPLFKKSPFHRFGVRLTRRRKRCETAGYWLRRKSYCSTRRCTG